MLARCPFCGATAQIEERFAGQVVSCYACRQAYTVPDASLTVLCPHCRTHVAVAKRYAGQVMTCAACGGQFTAPLF